MLVLGCEFGRVGSDSDCEGAESESVSCASFWAGLGSSFVRVLEWDDNVRDLSAVMVLYSSWACWETRGRPSWRSWCGGWREETRSSMEAVRVEEWARKVSRVWCCASEGEIEGRVCFARRLCRESVSWRSVRA